MGFPLTIGRDCTIGHKAMLHGCTIGDETLIGMGATVLNGARIGRNCLIGAGALITEGKEIPDGALVMGAPGRVVRQLDEAGIQRLRASALHYQDRALKFRDDLKPLT
jgi:carbonic anhydrase/acetyltransferase-like protein (isoleucine patch superfamily)